MDAPEYVPGHGLLADRIVVVTAAAGAGIGFAVAKKAVEEGATVVISDVHERRRFDLCPDCYRKYVRNPLGCEMGTPFEFSDN